MHYAVANNNTECVKALVNWPEAQGGGLSLLKVSPILLLSLSLSFSISITSMISWTAGSMGKNRFVWI